MKIAPALLRLHLACVLFVAIPAHAGENGYLGISIQAEGEGAFWNPTIKSVKVAKVGPGSPAEAAGIAVGDSIVEIEGRPVAGAKASDLRPYMQREVGQQLRLVVRRPSGELKTVSVAAGAKPN